MAPQSPVIAREHEIQFHECLGRVQNRARLATEAEAVKATRATLEALGQRLAGGEPANLAEQLPEEVGRFLQSDGGTGERFDLDECFRRVRAREAMDLPVAVFYARAARSRAAAQLPAGYDRLFVAGAE